MKNMFKKVTPNINFPELEKKIMEYWEKEKIVNKYLHKNDESKKRFSFIDGPITANNPMGVHHAWGRTYKDLWQRYNNMKGYRERFQNGFDCQGLWIEVEVEKELGIRNKKDIENLIPGDKKASIAKFVELCKERVRKFSKIQTAQSKRLGYFMDWDHSYYTMSDENNYMIWHFLKVCYEKGWIYKGKDSVPWCPRCETAISQHEMLTEDYKEIVHESIIMKFPLVNRDSEYLLVWTTTPWTIIANIAVAVDETFDYVLVESDGQKYWLVKELVEQIFKDRDKKIIKKIKGKELIGYKYRGLFDHLPGVKEASSQSDKFHTVIPTDSLIMPISTTEGTGMVHTAVSAGSEDYKLGKKLDLPMIPVIADNADYIEGFGEFTGKNAKKHPEIILDYMRKKEEEEKSWVYSIFKYKHRYPACWRCKAELVWKVANEWYIAMDKKEKLKIKNVTATAGSRHDGGKKLKIEENTKTLREQMIETAKMINWIPGFGLERELDWLNNMHDWLISKKNRYWGLAIPIYECQKCGWFEVIGSKKELNEKAVSGWEEFEGKSPHKPYIDEVKIKCQKCTSEITRVDDVGNVWLDAGIVPFSTLVDPKNKQLSYTTDKNYWQDWFPATFITESFPGQFKNWFYSMIAMSTVLEKRNPFESVLGYASVLGEDGRPMHKSWGNAIEFNESADKIGVDVMRWMYVTQNPEQNILFGYKKADETRRKFHLMLWNIYNFFITYANADKWDPKQVNKSKSNNILDIWMLVKLNQLIKTVTDSLNCYDTFTASSSIQCFINDLSTWYIRRSRDRVGPTVENKEDKYNCFFVLYEILVSLTKIIAPFTPFLAEEIYINLTNYESVHLSDWFGDISELSSSDTEIQSKMSFIRLICELGHAKRKEMGIKVRQPLKKLKVQNTKLDVSEKYLQLIKDELNVKEVDIEKGDEELVVELDTKLTPLLIAEGKAREIVRQIQLKRKELGCGLTDRVRVTLSDWPKEFTQYIKKETVSEEINKGKNIIVENI